MIFKGHARENIQGPCLAVPSGKPIGLRIFMQCHQGNPSGSSRFLTPVGANTRYCQLRWQVHPHALCKQGCRCCGVCYLGIELLQGITYLRRGASFKQLARRRPEQQHVSHTCDSREQYIQMQPPVRILCASSSLRGNPSAINSRTCANRLPLRSSRSKEVCMSKCKALSLHSVRFRAPPSELGLDRCEKENAFGSFCLFLIVVVAEKREQLLPNRRRFPVVELQPNASKCICTETISMCPIRSFPTCAYYIGPKTSPSRQFGATSRPLVSSSFLRQVGPSP